MPPSSDYQDIIRNTKALGSLLVADQALTGNLDTDIARVRQVIEPSDDVRFAQVPGTEPEAWLVYQEGLSDRAKVATLLQILAAGKPAPATHTAHTAGEVVDGILTGAVAVLADGRTHAHLVPAPASLPDRRPNTERVVRGPHQSLVSDVETNLALVRNLAQRRDLRVEYHSIGVGSTAKAVLVYLGDSADPDVRKRFLHRLQTSSIASPVDVSVLTPSLADDPWSPFVNVQLTERVDLVATKVLRGGYAAMTTGSSQALLFPTTFVEMMASPEDRYLPRYMANFDRFIRWGAAMAALLFESLFIALTTVNQDLLPTPLAFAIARSRSGVPLPVMSEVLIMALVIEVLKEAAIRLPQILSQTIAIVGALVIGQAVVTASLISAPVIVVVGFVALASFALPQYELAVAIRLLRFPAMLIAAMFGLFGLSLYYLAIITHIAGLCSFGTPYMGPLAPRRGSALDVLVRVPPRLRKAWS